MTNPMEYLRSLQVKIRIEVTPHAHLARLHELSQKTNQFNLNLMRYSEVALAEALDAQDYRVAVVELADRMSNSGQIALIVAQKEKDALTVHEVAVSCRALGRNLEDFIIAETIRAILDELPAAEVRISHRTAARNNPAREWLARFSATQLAPEGQTVVTNQIKSHSQENFPVTLEVVKNEQHGIETASR
jgi:FkbH-like protein